MAESKLPILFSIYILFTSCLIVPRSLQTCSFNFFLSSSLYAICCYITPRKLSTSCYNNSISCLNLLFIHCAIKYLRVIIFLKKCSQIVSTLPLKQTDGYHEKSMVCWPLHTPRAKLSAMSQEHMSTSE